MSQNLNSKNVNKYATLLAMNLFTLCCLVATIGMAAERQPGLAALNGVTVLVMCGVFKQNLVFLSRAIFEESP